MPQGVNGHMHFRAPAAFGLVIARPGATFGRRLQGVAIEDGGRGLRVPSLRQPQHLAQIIHHPALSQRWLCWYTVCQGGRSGGIRRHAAPASTIHHRPWNTSRKLCSSCEHVPS